MGKHSSAPIPRQIDELAQWVATATIDHLMLNPRSIGGVLISRHFMERVAWIMQQLARSERGPHIADLAARLCDEIVIPAFRRAMRQPGNAHIMETCSDMQHLAWLIAQDARHTADRLAYILHRVNRPLEQGAPTTRLHPNQAAH